MITLVAILLTAALTGCGSTGKETGIISELVTEAPKDAANIPTNDELLAMINSAFGIMTDNSVEGNIQAAKDWDIIGENDVIDPNARIDNTAAIQNELPGVEFSSPTACFMPVMISFSFNLMQMNK